ncbi:MAG: hypothetical protein AB9835_06400 [Eubacteriales bacterium]
MKNIDTVSFLAQDQRVRRFFLPRRIVLTRGIAENTDSLLRAKDLQIGLNEPDMAVLSTRGAEKSGILLDFGLEFSGGIRMLTGFIDGQNPATVRIVLGESVSEALSSIGEKGATNDHSTRDMTVTLPFLSDMDFGQSGLRFAYIELLSPDTVLRIKSVLGLFIYNEYEYAGSFECSDTLLNNIFDTSAYTCHLNMQSMLWDGVKRDRLVWIGDMHPEMMTIRSVFGQQRIIEESLRFAMSQAALPGWMNAMPSYSLWWIIILRDWYIHNGDKTFLLENKDYVMGLLRQIAGYINDDGTDTLGNYFLDWPTNETPNARLGVRGLMGLAMSAGSELSALYGDTQLAELCSRKAKAIAASGDSVSASKAAVSFQAMAGIVDGKTAAEVIASGGAKGMSTFMSLYILKTASSELEMKEVLDILRTYYGGMLSVGATTFWEDFNIDWLENACPLDRVPEEGESDIHGDNGAFCYVGLRHSLCHGWSSGPVTFLLEDVLGIKITSAGCSKITIKPNLGDLEWAKGTYPTPFGILTVSCTRGAEGVKVEYNAPAGVEVIVG